MLCMLKIQETPRREGRGRYPASINPNPRTVIADLARKAFETLRGKMGSFSVEFSLRFLPLADVGHDFLPLFLPKE